MGICSVVHARVGTISHALLRELLSHIMLKTGPEDIVMIRVNTEVGSFSE